MIKMVFSDFDETLLNYYSDKNYFDEYQLDVLSRLRDKGIKFCIVTGRAVSFFDKFPSLLERIDYILASNGSCIYDVKKNEYIYQNSINEEIFRKIINYCYKNDYSFLVNSFGKRYSYGSYFGIECESYRSEESYRCCQLVVAFPKKGIEEVSNYLETLPMIVVNNVTIWDDYCSMDINNKLVSKGSSIVWLCDYLKVDKDDTIAFGDGNNDVSMFEVVGQSVAVGNSSDKIKHFSSDVSLSCSENGVFKYIEDNIL